MIVASHPAALCSALSSAVACGLLLAAWIICRQETVFEIRTRARKLAAHRLAACSHTIGLALQRLFAGIESMTLLLTTGQIATIVTHVTAHAGLRVEEMVDSLVGDRIRSWRQLPTAARSYLYEEVRARVPMLSQDVIGALFGRLSDFFSLRDLLHRRFSSDPEMLAQLLFATLDELLVPIAVLTACAAGCAGFLQWQCAAMIGRPWTLPLTGLILWPAAFALLLQLIFLAPITRPASPFHLHGLLHAFRHRLAARYARELAGSFSVIDCTAMILDGPGAPALHEFVKTRLLAGSGLSVLNLMAHFHDGLEEWLSDLSTMVIAMTVDALHAPAFRTYDRSLLDETLTSTLETLLPAQLAELSRGLFAPLRGVVFAVAGSVGVAIGTAVWILAPGT